MADGPGEIAGNSGGVQLLFLSPYGCPFFRQEVRASSCAVPRCSLIAMSHFGNDQALGGILALIAMIRSVSRYSLIFSTCLSDAQALLKVLLDHGHHPTKSFDWT
jgi:hypothetical protein